MKSEAISWYYISLQAYIKKGVLNQLYITNDVEYHQLVLPHIYHAGILKQIHDYYGHQGLY